MACRDRERRRCPPMRSRRGCVTRRRRSSRGSRTTASCSICAPFFPHRTRSSSHFSAICNAPIAANYWHPLPELFERCQNGTRLKNRSRRFPKVFFRSFFGSTYCRVRFRSELTFLKKGARMRLRTIAASALVLGTAVSARAESEKIRVCVNLRTSEFRLLTGHSCPANTRMVTWTLEVPLTIGSAGPMGPQGPAGPAGPARASRTGRACGTSRAEGIHRIARPTRPARSAGTAGTRRSCGTRRYVHRGESLDCRSERTGCRSRVGTVQRTLVAARRQ